MKHIKRKFLFHEYLQNHEQGTIEGFESFDPKEATQDKLKSAEKDSYVILYTENGEKVFSFVYNNKGTRTLIPVPDFALVNYNFAYKLNIDRKDLHNKLVENLKDVTIPNEVSSTYAYDFQGCASTVIIGLFTSVECFINDIIPEKFEYRIENNRKTELFNKEQIQATISFHDKLTKVLPQALSKNFFINITSANSHIIKLRDLRNEIVHPKSDVTGKTHAETLKKLLSFKYDETFEAVFKFFNFYKPTFIEECPCPEEW